MKRIKLTHVLFTILLASLMFGGTFTCKNDSTEVHGTTGN